MLVECLHNAGEALVTLDLCDALLHEVGRVERMQYCFQLGGSRLRYGLLVDSKEATEISHVYSSFLHRMSRILDLLGKLKQPVDLLRVSKDITRDTPQDDSIILVRQLVQIDLGESVEEALWQRLATGGGRG